MLRLVRQTRLFDVAFYEQALSPNSIRGMSPLEHYVREGDNKLKQPSEFFDPAYYIQTIGPSALKVNTLLHYAYWGRFHGVSPSPNFDIKYYLARNQDVVISGIDPLYHYIRHGRYEGRRPIARSLDSAIQLIASEPTIPTVGEWDELVKNKSEFTPKIDVIVPVYGAIAFTLRCILSVLKSNANTPYELIIIDDLSPDVELRRELESLASQKLITLVCNQKNLGFVASVNRGFKLHPDRDVVILNSDTEVYGDWLDRLCAAASRRLKVATVTPLSNNATICSYPFFNQDNNQLLEIDYPKLDVISSRANKGSVIEVPTGVGFCMYISRAALSEVGEFDEIHFGRGYGEENDFCQRAIRAGWINLVAGDVFVRHWGGSSFNEEKKQRVFEAMQTMGRLHPQYHRDVRKFIENDKLKPVRETLDLERLSRLMSCNRNVLVISHSLGGGTERHVREDIANMLNNQWGVVILRPIENGEYGRVEHAFVSGFPNLPRFSVRKLGELIRFLRFLHITDIHIHSLVGFNFNMLKAVKAIARALPATIEFNVHDYACICPRINLVGPDGIYCGEPNEIVCNECIASDEKLNKEINIGNWRRMYAELFSAASKVDMPDEDVKIRLRRYFPAIDFTVTPHEKINSKNKGRIKPSLVEEEPLHVVVIGAISAIKGYTELLVCAQDALQHCLPIRFSLLGYSFADQALIAAGVAVTGRYNDHEAADQLRKLQPHVVWLPSIWPETYSYTLSLAVSEGYSVAAYDIGAIANRLKKLQMADWLLPLDIHNEPAKWNQLFLSLRQELLTG